MIKDLNEVEPIRKYLLRIGAEARSLNKAVISTKIGRYWKDTHTIKFTKDGIVVVTSNKYAPTDSEQDEIKVAWSKAEIPTCIPATSLSKLPKAIQRSKELYEFKSVGDKEYLMLQSRIQDKKTGDKRYVPWTYWTDKQWRPMEPDEKLPLFGLETLKDHEIVFIHEGAKSALYAQQIAEGTIAHPWAEELANAAHLGWIGGALNPARTDWAPLKRAGIKQAYIVADNDEPGRASIVHISKQLRCITFSLQFTDEFPVGFDLADKFPASMYMTIAKKKHYNGPAFQNLLHPATWMTDLIPQEKGRPTVVLRECAKDLWAYVESIDMLVCKEMPSIRLGQGIANKVLAPFSHTDNVSRLIIKSQRGRTTGIAYRPDKSGLRITNKEISAINVHTPSPVRAIKGEVQPFINFLSYMLPDEEECYQLQRWIATLVARPDIRMGYGPLLISEKHGLGKTTLAECILAPLIGWSNVSFPNEMSFLSSFNGWAVNKRLVVANEIYQGHSWKVYNMLKTVITDQNIEVNMKHMPTYNTDNFCHVYACSNKVGALKMDDEDRRWFVPSMERKKWSQKQFSEFRGWLTSGGLNIIRYWAEQFEEYVGRGEHAPSTETKVLLVEEGYSEVTKRTIDFAIKYTNAERPISVPVTELYNSIVRVLKDEGNKDIYDKASGVKNTLMKHGFMDIGQRIHVNGRLQHVLVNSFLKQQFGGKGLGFDGIKAKALEHKVSFEEEI